MLFFSAFFYLMIYLFFVHLFEVESKNMKSVDPLSKPSVWGWIHKGIQ